MLLNTQFSRKSEQFLLNKFSYLKIFKEIANLAFTTCVLFHFLKQMNYILVSFFKFRVWKLESLSTMLAWAMTIPNSTYPWKTANPRTEIWWLSTSPLSIRWPDLFYLKWSAGRREPLSTSVACLVSCHVHCWRSMLLPRLMLTSRIFKALKIVQCKKDFSQFYRRLEKYCKKNHLCQKRIKKILRNNITFNIYYEHVEKLL